MPSSVVFAALVLAWLVVLVPVVARRRQMVPRTAEADLSSKVLTRGAAGAPIEKVAPEEVPVADVRPNGRGATAMSRLSAGSAGGRGATALAEREDDADLDRELDLDAHDGADGADGAEDDDRPSASRERVLERPGAATDDPDDRFDGGFDDRYDDVDGFDDRDDEDDDPDEREPRAFRPGRGGFDPEAAEVAAHARYAFRQRVALGLIAVAVLAALAALVVTPALWWLHAASALVLIGYLVFLRRQTRIEEEVRSRRAARLSGERRALEARRARQAQHDDLMAAHRRESEDWDGAWPDDAAEELDEVDDTDEVPAPVEEPAPRWAAPRTPAPPVPAGMDLVDDTVDDPAFHDLDADRVPAYRRAAGA